MAEINVFNVEFDGIDKTGKDTIKQGLWYVAPGKYLSRARGLLSQIAYAKLYDRDIEYVDEGYTKNTLFVFLTVDKEDWKIRCRLTNEKDIDDDDYESHTKAFENAVKYIIDKGVPTSHIMHFNTSYETPYQIIKSVNNRLKELNNLE